MYNKIVSPNQQINLPHFQRSPWQPVAYSAVLCSAEAPAVATTRGRLGGGTFSPRQSAIHTQLDRSDQIDSLLPPLGEWEGQTGAQ